MFFIDKGISYRNIQRNACYIGRLNPGQNRGNYNGAFDDLKIFSRGLSQQEITYEMNRV